MIKTITLNKYRCFDNITIPFKDISVIVGKNNVGKSTLLESIRLVALAIRKSTHTTYINLPKGLGFTLREKGFRLDVTKLKINLKNIVYYYGEDVARITARMTDGSKIVIVADADGAYAVLFDQNGKNIVSKNSAEKAKFETVDILPQIGLLREEEKRLTDATIENDKETYLSSLHFRNEIYNYRNEYFEEFKRLAQETWPGLRLDRVSYDMESGIVSFFVINDGFATEIYHMGSGVKMWLQMMWFLCRTKDSDTIILDEPDVYMHPDLQRKLIRLVKGRYPQVIIATHSLEIMSEVDPENILTITAERQSLKESQPARHISYASDYLGVQKIIDEIGSVSNISLLKLGTSRKCIFVEGDDMRILAEFMAILYPNRTDSIKDYPIIKVKGFHNLREAYGTSELFYHETDDTIKCYGILDRDYFLEETLEKTKEEAQKHYLRLHIWERKEIENYLLNPKVLFRMTRQKEEMYSQFIDQFERIVDECEDEVLDAIAEEYRREYPDKQAKANNYARSVLKKRWTNLDDKLCLVGGKKVLKKVRTWMKKEYNISPSNSAIIKHFTKEDICFEVVELIKELM